MQSNYLNKIASTQALVAPVLQTLVRRVGYVASLAAFVLFVSIGREVFTREFDKADVLIALVHLPFAILVIYFITDSRSNSDSGMR
jgi:hypothetical protein